MTPNIRNVNRDRSPVEHIQTYLEVFRRTRFRVENSIGILKIRFPCLKGLRLASPLKVSNIANACVTLHNIQNKFKNEEYDFFDENVLDESE